MNGFDVMIRIQCGEEWTSVPILEATDDELNAWIDEHQAAGMLGWNWVRAMVKALREAIRERDVALAAFEASDKAFCDTADRRIVTCVYCGHEYPEGTPQSQDERLTEHIKVCEKHPMRALEAENAALRVRLVRAEERLL